MTGPRLCGPARRRGLLPRALSRLVATVLVLALGACDNVRRMDPPAEEPETAGKAGTQKVAAGPPAPAPPKAAAKPPPDPCELRRALATWSDSSLAQQRYGVYVAVQFARKEVESQPPRGAGLPGTAADSAAAKRVCEAAREQKLDSFLSAYRPVTPATALTTSVVRTLTEISPTIASSTRSSTNALAATDTVAGASDSTVAGTAAAAPDVHRVEVPRMWLIALIALIAVGSAAVGYARWRLGRTVRDSGRWLHDSNQRQHALTITAVQKDIDHAARVLKEDVENAHKTTRAEMSNCFGRVRTEVAMLRETLAKKTGDDRGTADSYGSSGERRFEGDAGGNSLVLDPDPWVQWEEATVDVRPAAAGPATIQADSFGVFQVRWPPGSTTQAHLSVLTSQTLGAAHRDKLEAAFRCRRVVGGTGRYRTVRDALCTWDPVTRQGRITEPGEVEEIG